MTEPNFEQRAASRGTEILNRLSDNDITAPDQAAALMFALAGLAKHNGVGLRELLDQVALAYSGVGVERRHGLH